MSRRESFVQGYNTLYNFGDDSDVLYRNDIERLSKLFSEFNKIPLPDYKRDFQFFPNILTFPLNDEIKKQILPKIKEIIKEDNLEIFQNISNIYWKDNVSGSREFIFTINIIIRERGFSQKLLVYINFINMKDFLMDSGEIMILRQLYPEDIQILNISVENIKNELTVKFLPNIENKDGLFYQIKNKLHLMDPFVTSGKDMKITDEMIKNFDEDINSRYVVVQEEPGFCFGTPQLTNIKSKCKEMGGVWDTVPENDYQCPYFNSNLNYPNSFGKLVNTNCELPINMKRVGHRYFSLNPEDKPLCYNCKDNTIGDGSLGFCCEEQNNRYKYPSLNSPDYAFLGDSELRKTYKDDLGNKFLKIE